MANSSPGGRWPPNAVLATGYWDYGEIFGIGGWGPRAKTVRFIGKATGLAEIADFTAFLENE